jgi:hypothetical protein
MSRVALTYSRREWAIELLLLLAQGLLVWMVADVLVSPFTSRSDPIPVWLPVGLVMLAGLLPRIMHDYGVWNRSFGLVMLAAIVLTTLATVKVVAFPAYPWAEPDWLREATRSLVFEQSTAELTVWAPIGLSAAIWWLARVNGPPGLERCRTMLLAAAMVTGVVSVVGYVVIAGPSNRAVSAAIIVVFSATLVALAIARQGHEATRSRRRLLTTVLIPTLAIVAAATGLASIVTFDGFRSSSAALSFLDVVLEPFFQLLILALTGIVIIISLPIVWLLSLGDYRGIPQVAEFGNTGQADPARAALDWQPPEPVRYLLAFLVLLAIFYGLTRFGLALTRRDYDPLETGEREFGTGKGFGAWLDRFRGRFGRAVSRDPLAELRNDPDWANTVTIREAYANWLRFAESRKLGRSAGETADELDRRVGPTLHSPAASAALDELTALYDHVRYASVPASAEQAERALRAWNQLKSAETATTKS